MRTSSFLGRLVGILLALAFATIVIIYLVWFLGANRDPVTIVLWEDWNGWGLPQRVGLPAAFSMTHTPVWFFVVMLGAFSVGCLVTALVAAAYIRRGTKDAAALARLEEGLDELVRKDFHGARRHLAGVSGGAATSAEGAIALARVHEAQGDVKAALHDLDEAERHLERTRTRSHGLARIALARARVLDRAGRPHEAAAELERAVERSGPSVGLLEALRDLDVRLERWDEAYERQKLLRTLVSDRDEAAVRQETERLTFLRYETARARLAAGKTEEAEGILKDLVKKHTSFVPAYVTLGDVLVETGRAQEAIRLWERAYRHDPQLVLMDRLEEACIREEDPGRALRVYEEALRQDEKDMVLRYMHAKLCLRIGMLDDAFDELARIESEHGPFPELSILKGEAHHERKELDAAVTEFRRAVRLEGLRYTCLECGADTNRWEARCATCRRWDTLRSAVRIEIEGIGRRSEQPLFAPPPGTPR